MKGVCVSSLIVFDENGGGSYEYGNVGIVRGYCKKVLIVCMYVCSGLMIYFSCLNLTLFSDVPNS